MIKIKNKDLPSLLGKIGEAIAKGEDLVISELSVNPEIIDFTDDEISLMEETKVCPEIEDEVDLYYCKKLCSKEGCKEK